MHADRRLARIAAGQHGVFTRAQAAKAGLSPSEIQQSLESGRWEYVFRGVYRMAGAPVSWHQNVLAACLAVGGAAVASHLTAGALWGLEGVDSRSAIELTVPRSRRSVRAGIVVHEAMLLDRVDITRIGAIPVTRPARTLLDLSAALKAEALERAVDDALRRGLVSLPRLLGRFEALASRGRPGVAALRPVLADQASGPPPGSFFERRLFKLLRGAGVPLPVRNTGVTHRGRFVATVDFAYPEARVFLEADGYEPHSGRLAFDSDRIRQNKLARLGWLPLRFTWTDLTKRPEEICRTIAEALGSRGSAA